MATVNEKMKAIADAIREKTGTEYKLSLDGMAQSISDVHDAGKTDGVEEGKQAQYDEFWDGVQSKGAKTDYQSAFAGVSWNDKTFKPKYNIKPTNAYHMFNRSTVADLVGILERQGVTLDFSKATDVTALFTNARQLTRLGKIDFSSVPAGYLGETFFYCLKLHTIEKLVIPDKNYTFTNMFNNCISLENIVIEGTMGNSIDFKYCPLSKDSIESVIASLSATVNGKTLTLNKSAVNEAFLINVDDERTYPIGTEFYNLRHSKDNWTFNYV